MPDEPEILDLEPVHRPDPSDEDEEAGGPVKTFLEHLEDLRWTIIKCFVSVLLGVVVCLSSGNFIIRLLTWPLQQAMRMRTTSEPYVVVSFGTNILGRLPLAQFPVAGASTNKDLLLRLQPLAVGTNLVMALVTDTNPPVGAEYGMRVDLKVLSPGGGFTIAVQIALFGGITVSAPFVLFFLGQFILPALHMHEKKFLNKVVAFATGLFFAGVGFCYFLMLPITLGTTVAFSNWLGFGSDMWRADDLISFSCWFLLGMGLSFELPLVLLTLVKIGLLDVKGLTKYRSYFYVAILIIAGFVTPDGNPVNMLLMSAPLMVLYELTIVVAWFWARQEARDAVKSE